MPDCQNCGAHVSDRYVRVVGRDGEVRACPRCPDRVRANGQVREAKSGRNTARAVSSGELTDDE